MNAELQLPLVYSCSGCSSAAQMANHLALRLDRAGAAEMSCSAGARDFLRLVRREVDPDTLFFDRQLSIEGDTELGLLLKNTLDAIDLKSVLGTPPGPLRLLSALRA